MNDKAYHRGTRGSIIELAPVLLVLFLFLVFPLLDMLSLGLSYVAGSMLNHAQLRLAAITPASQLQDTTGPPMSGVTQIWQAEGLGKFVLLQANSPPKCQVTYSPAFAGSTDFTVGVTTTIVARPFLNMPLFPGVPGLGAPMTFSYYSERLLEDPRNAPSKT